MWYMNEDRQMVVNMVREFAETELAPVAVKYDMDPEESFPLEQFKRAGELGLLSVTWPEKYGGMGADYTTLALVYEEIAKVMPALTIGMGAHTVLAGELLILLGNDEQKEKWLAPAATGEAIITVAQTEAAGGMNRTEWACTAELDGDEYVINGAKMFCSNLQVSDYYIVLCVTNEVNPVDASGISALVVPADTPGVSCGAYEKKLGWHGSATGTLSFENVRVPKENLLGAVDRGMIGLMISATNEFMSCGAVGLGMAEACYDMAYKYAHERIQNGKSLWENYQVIRHMLVDMWTQVETLRGLVFSAFAEKDAGAMNLGRSRLLKNQGAHISMEVADKAIQIFGGLGCVKETGVERFWRDARVMHIGGAAVEALKDDIAGYMDRGIENN